MTLADLLPEAVDDILALASEELALPVLRFLAWMEENRRPPTFVAVTSTNALTRLPGGPAASPIFNAIAEAWAFLESERLIACQPGDNSRTPYFVTRRGRALLADEQRWRDFRAGQLVQWETLHPRVAEEARPEFLRGDFETAIFKAFKAVEVATREAAGLGANAVGVALMRSAFHPETGALTDPDAERGERDAMTHLFSGAMGVFKNPPSHRYTRVDDPRATIEQIMFASTLMRIIDQRRLASDEPSG